MLPNFEAWTERALCGGVSYFDGVLTILHLYGSPEVQGESDNGNRYVAEALAEE